MTIYVTHNKKSLPSWLSWQSVCLAYIQCYCMFHTYFYPKPDNIVVYVIVQDGLMIKEKTYPIATARLIMLERCLDRLDRYKKAATVFESVGIGPAEDMKQLKKGFDQRPQA
ncbi:hypothetical protein BDF20DRAFT_839878 [Mycotypha africana]|uniref:uncharacterized protein n=1 Tax=Mycotypha africana TaxID=64632 RepID=UPI0023002EF5|nr:uncharacterized protein BDF20DRAFT_839878 [Mycotypha africana]KAI8968058.1 hypothetical protein BDF20DRAFT_839878 [Mycotypha africana]